MSRAYSLQEFIREMQVDADRHSTAAEMIAVGTDRLRQVLSNPDVLPVEYRKTAGVGAKPNHGTYNLYRGRNLFVSASVWGPGDRIDPHNHGTWGLIGVVENAIQETRYRVVGTDDREFPRVERVNARLVRQGEVVALKPTDDEIHELDNFSRAPTVEIHVYGANLVGLERFSFDRTTGLAKRFCSGKYDNC